MKIPFLYKNAAKNAAHKNMQYIAQQEVQKSSNFLAFANLGEPIWSSRNYAGFAREAYGQNPIAYRAVRLIAEAVSSVPMKIFGENGEIHEFQKLLDAPNFEQSFAELIESFVGHLQIGGNSYLELVSLDGIARELLVLRPDTISVLQGAYGVPIGWEQNLGSQKRRLYRDFLSGKSEVLHLKTFNPLDEIYGQSPLLAAATAIDIHNSGGAWNKALIDNAARPSGALVYKGASGNERLSDEQFERLKAELSAAHTSAANAGRPLLLEGGLEWSPMSLTPMEMDFIEARRQASRDIALAFGIPPMILGIPGDNTYSNYKEANLALWRQTILPLVNKICHALGAFLSPWAGEKLEIKPNLDGVSALSAERDNLWARLEAANFLTQEEKRHIAGLDISGGAK